MNLSYPTRREMLISGLAVSTLGCTRGRHRSPRSSSELGYMPAADMARRFRTRSLSPVEVVEALVARISAHNPKFQAIYFVDHEGALAQARASEERWRSGQPLSSLDGVPATIKDYVDVAGLPSPGGRGPASRLMLRDSRDALSVSNLRNAGVVILAKATAPEMPYVGAGVSALYGPVRNPWNLALTSGGSSSGSGSAAAAGFGPLHLGSDAGSSVRGPASYCGVVGLKPSAFRVPAYDSYAQSLHGPITHTVEDAALALDVLARRRPEDPNQLRSVQHSYLAAFSPDFLKGKRLGVCSWVGDDAPRASSEVLDALHRSARIAQSAGAKLVDVGPFVQAGLWSALGRWQIGNYGRSNSFSDEELAALLPFHRATIAAGKRLTRAQVAAYEVEAKRLLAATRDPLDGLDLLLLPTMPGPPQRAELPWPEFAAMDEVVGLAYNHLLYAAIFNLLGHPAISIPASLSPGGLPIGMQMVAKRGDDASVLAGAAALLAHIPALPRPIF